MSRRNKQKEVLFKTEQCINYWLMRILRLASSSIEWVGLPDYLNTVIMENYLNRTGSAMIGYDDMLDRYFSGQNASVGNIDIEGYPMDRRIIFMNGDGMKFTPENSVIIYNNSMRMADIWIFEQFARRMANMDMAIDINVESQKTMPIIPTTQQQQLTIQNVYNNREINMPYTLVDQNGFNSEALKNALMFDNRKSFTSDLIMQVQREIWSRCLTFIGVNNLNIDKRERTNVPEVNSNLDEILIMRRDRLNQREVACRKLNEIFGWKCSVRYYSDVREVNENGSLYNGDINDLQGTLHATARDMGQVSANREDTAGIS